MSDTNQLQELADFLWEVLTDQPPTAEEQQEQLTERLVGALEANGFRGVSNEQLAEALGTIETRINNQQVEDLDALSIELNQSIVDVSIDLEESLSQDFDAGIEESMTQLRVEHIQPLRTEIENMPDPVINQITHRHITNVDDRVTNVTNRHITNVDESQTIMNETTVEKGGVANINTVQSRDGAVAVGGSADAAVVNTGTVEGVQAGGDVDADNATIGDANIAVSDAENVAVGGDVNDIDQESVIDAPALEGEVITEPALEEAVITEPVFEDAVLDDSAALDDAAAAEADAAAIEAELDV